MGFGLDVQYNILTHEWNDVLSVLRQIPERIERTVVGQASKKAFQPVKTAARANLRGHSSGTGLLRKSLGLAQRKRRGVVYTIFGPRRGFKARIGTDASGAAIYANPVNYAHLVELGTDPHWIAPRGRSGALAIKRGRGATKIVEGAVWHPGARAKPFLRPAWDARKRAVLSGMAGHMRQGILKQVSRYEKKAKAA